METTLKDLDRAVLATVCYHDILNMPLTATEIWRYLFLGNNLKPDHPREGGDPWIPAVAIRPRAHGRGAGMVDILSSENVDKSLKSLGQQDIIQTHSGYYFFPGRKDLVERRLKMHALAQTKWKRLRRIAWFLQAIPFLEMVAASGSLARDFTHKDSDLDVLLVTKSGRIWTVRFIVTVLLDFFRLRRRPTGATRDLVCLNHYLAEDGLALPYQSLYTALEYARVVPLIGAKVCTRFREANRGWMENYLVRLLSDEVENLKVVRRSTTMAVIKRTGEILLNGKAGNAIEAWLGKRQKERIAKNEASNFAGGRIVASSFHLEFHPHSKEAPLLKKFNERMSKMGLEKFGGQKDSGLTKI